jgi:probable rRNA maturation factor
LRIRVFYEEVKFRIKGWKEIKSLIGKVISEEKNISGDLNFILTNANHLLKINKEFLKHNYYTDVISFDNTGDSELAHEIYISIDTVKKNSINYNVSYKEELIRVMIHGVLHLCGYEDRSNDEKEKMREREDYWLNIMLENGEEEKI